MSKEAWALYLQFALLNFVVSYSLTYWATQFVYSSVSAIIWAGFPLVITFISHFMLINEKLTWSKLGTILFGTAGVLLMLSQGKELGGNNVVLGVSALGCFGHRSFSRRLAQCLFKKTSSPFIYSTTQCGKPKHRRHFTHVHLYDF